MTKAIDAPKKLKKKKSEKSVQIQSQQRRIELKFLPYSSNVALYYQLCALLSC